MQLRLSLCYSHKQSMDVYEGSEKRTPLAPLDTPALAFIRGISNYAISTHISCPDQMYFSLVRSRPFK